MKISVRPICPCFNHRTPLTLIPLAAACLLANPASSQQTIFNPGNLIVSVEGCGVYGSTCTVPNGTGTGSQNSSQGGYGDNQAAPLTLFQFSPAGTSSVAYVNSLVLPQQASGVNLPVSGEYGSSSEGTLQLSSNGQYLAILGYGINAATFDANPTQYGAAPSLALAQSTSLTSSSTTPVARVLALIDANGNVSSSTALYNIFNLNNPRSVFTANGTSAYVSGQGASGDTTGGVFTVPVGTTTSAPTAITGADTTGNTVAQDTRDVRIVNNMLYVSVDSKAGSGSNRDFVGTLGTAGTLPTSLTGGPVMLSGFGASGGAGKVTIANNGNGINSNGLQINLSPENFFFASPSVLYVADSGAPKQTSATSTLGDGGLQKWINTAADGSGTWNLAYTLSQGLHLVANTNTDGVSGLFGLTGQVVGGQVQLFATSYALADLDQTFLYGISDTLSDTTATAAAGESFNVLATAPQDSNFKGVSFAPTAPATTTLAITNSFALQGSNYLVTLTVTNSGTETAQNLVLTNVTVGSASAGSLPVSLGPIAAGSSASATLLLPASAGPQGSTVIERIAGTYSGGSISSAGRIQLP